MKYYLSLFVISCLLSSLFSLSVLSNTKKFKTSTLHENERLVSKNGKYFAELKTDGNFILYLLKEEPTGKETELQIWETKTHGKGHGPYKLVMQQDGDLVLYDGKDTKNWESHTSGKGTKPYRLVMQDDGNLVIYSHDGAAIWATHTAEPSKKELKTQFQDDGSGSIFFLDRHTVSCGEHQAINSFKLEKDHKKIRYVYTCVLSDQHITNECHDKETPLNDTDHNEKTSTDFLDRHKIACEDGNVLRSFALHRKDHKINYKYQCCKAHLKSCSKRNYEDMPKHDKSTHSLDNHNVDATGVDVFSSIHLTAQGKNYSYHNKVCKLDYVH
jgi:hypothetical protein